MTEQLISLATAKLAKEKGFNWNTYNHYDRRNYNNQIYEVFPVCNIGNEAIPATTQSLLQKWLRDIHKLHIRITCNLGDWYFEIDSIPGFISIKSQGEQEYLSYEEALEAGLKAALNLISQDSKP